MRLYTAQERGRPRAYASLSPPATRPPPQPRAYQPVLAEERKMPSESLPMRTAAPASRARLPPSTSRSSAPAHMIAMSTRDPARGLEAARRVVTEGVLDPRYQRAARSYTAIIVALPLALYLSYELYQRRFMGKAQGGVSVAAVEEKAISGST